MIVAGLTGSIGMGKSTVTGMLREMGVPVHDSDATVHMLMGPNGDAVQAIAALCPEALKTDEQSRSFIDRKILGRHMFADPAMKKAVEDVLYPLVHQSQEQFIAEKEREGHALVVLDVPLLFETGWDKSVDKTIVVSAPADVQRARVLARPGMTEQRLNDVLKAQLPDAEKRARADFVIDNGGSLDETRAQIAKVVADIAPKTNPPKPRFQP